MKQSAGILLYKSVKNELQFFLVHPGGPFWKNKDSGAWSIPKGEFSEDENQLDAAVREFREETGISISGEFKKLQPVRLKSGKIIHAWALEGDIDADAVISNTFEIEWPPKSGKTIEIPEIDRGAWFAFGEALGKINPAQQSFIEETARLTR